ncbi:MAG: hypothetical protein OSA49_15030 [Ascidiaceihabitans sp.]|nr:hypothetical protein [Ascidiaceihabitans sp.]MDE1132856.1 hypothetical protein [Ascidiaceihabitans sp.]
MLRIAALIKSCKFLGWALAFAVVFVGAPQIGRSATDTQATTEVPEQASTEITGFRSATFGMDKAAVVAAIATDFDIKAADISEGVNTVERTELLTVLVPDLLEGGGTAQVSYIFGYESKTLIQIGASWNATIDAETNDKELVANGDVLSNHFQKGNYAPNSVTTPTTVANGVLLFRGLDTEGRSAILLLQGIFEKVTDGTDALRPTGLALLYSADPDSPDIFRIKDGSF